MTGHTIVDSAGQFVRFVTCAPDELPTLLRAGERVQTDAERSVAVARALRAERARLLAACDWTQLPDVPAGTSAAWATYRQALRDVTSQPGWPTDITWPVPPA